MELSPDPASSRSNNCSRGTDAGSCFGDFPILVSLTLRRPLLWVILPAALISHSLSPYSLCCLSSIPSIPTCISVNQALPLSVFSGWVCRSGLFTNLSRIGLLWLKVTWALVEGKLIFDKLGMRMRTDGDFDELDIAKRCPANQLGFPY